MSMYNTNKFQLRRLIPPVLVLSVLVVGLLIFQVLRFHLISTTPSLKSVSIITQSINFNYSSGLSGVGVKVSSSDATIKSFSVKNKSLVLDIDPTHLTVGKTYTISIGPLQDTRNRILGAKIYSFKVASVSFGDLTKTQQTAILNQQANVPYTRSSINYSGFDLLTKNGLSAYQLEDVKQALFLYSNSIKQKISQVTLETNSLVLGPYNSNSPNPVSSLAFKVGVDGTELGAKLVYSGLSSAELYLYDSVGNQQIFDSGLLTPASY